MKIKNQYLLFIGIVVLVVLIFAMIRKPSLLKKGLDMQSLSETASDEEVIAKLEQIQSRLTLLHGELKDEFNEQKMAVRFLRGHEKVLEIGGNVGRVSCVIASILNDVGNTDYIVLESVPDSANKLEENRKHNKLNFTVENHALSLRPLEQFAWNVREKAQNAKEDPGWFPVPSMTYSELTAKYNILFDTLVIDCEACFYTILRDMPDILTNINLILIENDYFDHAKRHFVEMKLKGNGFQRIYADNTDTVDIVDFYEAWRRKT